MSRSTPKIRYCVSRLPRTSFKMTSASASSGSEKTPPVRSEKLLTSMVT